MKIVALTTLLILSVSLCTHAQLSNDCDNVKINGSAFDSLFQHEFMALQADTILAAKHCYNTFNCGQSFGLLCWKEKGRYGFKLFTKNKGEIKTKSDLPVSIKRHILSFFSDEMYLYNTPVQDDYHIDDGKYSVIVYLSQTYCWRIGVGSGGENDIRVRWLRQLINSVRL